MIRRVPTPVLPRAIAAARVGFGIGLLAAPGELTRRWLGTDAGRVPTQVVVRCLAGRDLAIGLGGLLSHGSEQRRWLAAGVAADATDLASTLAAGAELPLSGRLGIGAVAGAAIVLGGAALAETRQSVQRKVAVAPAGSR
jgi:hypothetical protein